MTAGEFQVDSKGGEDDEGKSSKQNVPDEQEGV